MRRTKRKLIWFTGILVGALSLSAATLRAQDPPQQENPPQQQQQNPPIDTPPQAPILEVSPTVNSPVDTTVHPPGRTVPWLGNQSPLRWGDFSIGSFSYNYVNDRFAPIGGLPSLDLNLNILRTSLVFNHYFGKQQILLQYTPQLAFLNGKLAGNAGMDNELGLGTTFQVTPRFMFILKDGFLQVHSRQLYPATDLAIDQAGGNVIQNNFLQNAGSYLANTVTGIGVYQVSLRDTVTFSSAYKYAHAVGDPALNNNVLIQTGHDFAETVAYTHRLTARQNVGALYTLELLHQAENVDVPGTTFFHTIAGFYAIQVTETWSVRAQLGFNFTNYPDATPPVNTATGGFSIVKNLKNDRGNFALSYTRGHTDNNFLGARVGDLAQAAFSQRFFRRLVWNAGAGYYRETGADPRNTGKTLDTGLGFEVIPNVFMSAQYDYLFQRASIPELLSGRRNTVVLGIKWEPHTNNAR
jgi:hypothetical protein